MSLKTYETFVDGAYNVVAESDTGRGRGRQKSRCFELSQQSNRLHLHTGRGRAIRDTLVASAEAGNNIVVMIDDAYFGLVYEDGVYTESVFSLLANAHPGILAVKVDGATKEDYAWGLRVGFITYAFQGSSAEAMKALEDKTAGAVRGNISNAPHLSQSLLLKVYDDPEFSGWKKKSTKPWRSDTPR